MDGVAVMCFSVSLCELFKVFLNYCFELMLFGILTGVFLGEVIYNVCRIKHEF